MTRKPRHHALPAGATRPNFLAVLITCSAIGVLVLNFQLEPARAVSRNTAKRPVISQIAPRVAAPDTAGDTTAENGDTTGEQDKSSAMLGAVCRGRVALLLNIALLEDGIRMLEKHPGYTANFHKQEWLDEAEELTELQTIEIKNRHQPFSIYMHWLNGDAGREVLFVEGQHGNKMVVHAGGNGLKSKLTLSIAPDSSIAMGESRHPITQAGLLNLAKTMAQFRRRDLAHGDSVECCMGQEQLFNERPCYSFTLNFQDEEVEADYRKSVVLIDKEWSIPVLVQNFGWYDTEDEEMAKLTPEQLDEETFLEYYAFSNINFDTELRSDDFEKDSPKYRF